MGSCHAGGIAYTQISKYVGGRGIQLKVKLALSAFEKYYCVHRLNSYNKLVKLTSLKLSFVLHHSTLIALDSFEEI